MAAGVPVVASDVGGLRSIARSALRPVVPGSAPALAEAVTETFGNAQVRAEMVREAGEVVQTRFSSPTMAAAYFAVYDELARKTSGSQRREG
jgi:glycosyltransferase involved in cell wall biosynthesis